MQPGPGHDLACQHEDGIRGCSRWAVHSVRTVRRLEERMRLSSEAITGFRGVPWNRETTIGRPSDPIATTAEGAPGPQPKTPKPLEGQAGPSLPMVRAAPGKRSEEKPEEKAKKAKVQVTDSSARLDDEEMVYNPDAAGSGIDKTRRRDSAEDRAAVEELVKRWKQQEEEVETRVEGGPSKKLKVGEQTIGALFSAVDDPKEDVEI